MLCKVSNNLGDLQAFLSNCVKLVKIKEIKECALMKSSLALICAQGWCHSSHQLF